MTERLRSIAGGRVVLALEGGYDLDAISRAAAACTRVLLGEAAPGSGPRPPAPGAGRILDAVRAGLQPFWPGL